MLNDKDYTTKADEHAVKRIKQGWVAHRDYNNAYITNGKETRSISIACYKRLVISGLAQA